MYKIIVLMIMTPGLLSAQSAIVDQYVQQAITQNLSIQSSKLAVIKQQSKAEQAGQLWKPNVDLSASYLFAQGGRNLVFPIGDLFNPAYVALNQLTGTEAFPTDLENEQIQLTPNNFLDAQLSISKPLINSSIKYNQLIQKELIQLNQIDITLTEQDIVYQVKTGYYNYLKSIEAINIIKENQALLQEVLAFNQKLVKYNKATKEILSDVEVQIANLNSQETMINEQKDLSRALLNLLINRPLETEIEVDENLVSKLEFETLMLEELTQQAQNQRSEVKKIDVAQGVNELNKTRIDKSKLPTLGINAGVGLQTEAFNFNDGGPLYTAAIGLSWKIIDGGLRKKQIEELQIDQQILDANRKQINQQIQIEVLQAYLSLRSLLSQLDSQNTAVESANNSYQIIKTRYENDNALLIELLNAQNQLTNGQMALLLTKYDYLIQRAQLDKFLAK